MKVGKDFVKMVVMIAFLAAFLVAFLVLLDELDILKLTDDEQVIIGMGIVLVCNIGYFLKKRKSRT